MPVDLPDLHSKSIFDFDQIFAAHLARRQVQTVVMR